MSPPCLVSKEIIHCIACIHSKSALFFGNKAGWFNSFSDPYLDWIINNSIMSGGCGIQQMVQDSTPWFQYAKKNDRNEETSSACTSSIGEESMDDDDSVSSLETADDASSSLSSSLSSNSGEALYNLSEIMAQLPIKRGLSKFYQGKSESFTSLARVTSSEDLAKKIAPYRRSNLKASKSCATGLNNSYKPYTLPAKAVISKKATRVSSFSSLQTRKGSFVTGSKPPVIPLH